MQHSLSNTCLACMKPWVVQSSALHTPAVMAYGCNLREVEAGESEVQDHPQLHRETEASLDYKPYLKKNNNALEFRAITLSWIISFDYDLVILQYFPLYLFWITVK